MRRTSCAGVHGGFHGEVEAGGVREEVRREIPGEVAIRVAELHLPVAGLHHAAQIGTDLRVQLLERHPGVVMIIGRAVPFRPGRIEGLQFIQERAHFQIDLERRHAALGGIDEAEQLTGGPVQAAESRHLLELHALEVAKVQRGVSQVVRQLIPGSGHLGGEVPHQLHERRRATHEQRGRDVARIHPRQPGGSVRNLAHDAEERHVFRVRKVLVFEHQHAVQAAHLHGLFVTARVFITDLRFPPT